MSNIEKESFLFDSQKKLFGIIHRLTKTHQNNRSSALFEAYNLLKGVQTNAALFKYKEVFEICTFLLKRLLVNGYEILLKNDDDFIFFEGLSTLNEAINSILSPVSQKHLQESREEKKNICIYEPDAVFLEWMIDEFKHTDYQLIPVKADDILSNLYEYDFEVIILNTSNEQGLELVQVIRSEYNSTIPLICITHNRSEDWLAKLMKLKINHVLHKPFSFSILQSSIQNSIQSIVGEEKHTIVTVSEFQKERSRIQRLIEKEWMRFERFQSIFSLVLLKIETYEYIASEYKALYYQHMSDILNTVSRNLRPYDENGFWSKGSIVLLLPATPLEGARVATSRIIQSIQKSSNPLAKFISAGVIQSEIGYKNSNKLILRLEKELIGNSNTASIKLVPFLHENETSPQVKNNKILIIDDDLISSTILFTNLKEDNWNVEMCYDGSNALDHVLAFQPDIILCETKMKDLDGFSFCLQVKQMPQYKDTVFCFLSKNHLKQVIIRAFQIGADDYFLKPFSVQELEIRMMRHLSTKRK